MPRTSEILQLGNLTASWTMVWRSAGMTSFYYPVKLNSYCTLLNPGFFLLQSHADPKPSCIQLLPQCTECHIYCGSSGHLTSTSLLTFEQPPPYCSPYAPCLSAGLHIPHEGKNIRCILVYCPAFPASHNVPAWAHHINTS